MAIDIFGPIIKDDEPGGGTQPTVVERIERLNQPIKQYTAENIAVNLNVYTGKPTITHTDMCVGAGNYQIPVSHVYRDDLVGISAPVTIGFGNGWKLNLHQYVYPYQASYNYPRFSSGDYVYIDDVGYKHRFVKYKTEDGFDVYYDADGTGLRLKLLADNKCEVYNDVTRLHFDASGRLDKIISPFNEILDKIIVYENNKLTAAYVAGKTSRQLQFTYAGNLLDEIKCAGHANTLKFTYDTTSLKLTSVDLVNGDTSKNIATYVYNTTSGIILAYNALKNQGIKVTYGLYDRVSSVKTGPITSADITTPLNYDQYTYATGANKTEVTNEKSITLAYNFDLKGRACGTLEKETSGELTNYRTLQKGTGWSLSADSTSTTGEKINGKTVSSVENTIAINSDRVTAFKNIFGENAPHRFTDRFTFSCWLKPTADITGTAAAILAVSTSNDAHNTMYSIKLRNLRKDAWHYVTIPVYFDKNPTGTTDEEKLNQILARKNTITSMTFSVSGMTSAKVSDMRITVGAPAQIMVDGVVFKDQAIACITSGFDYTVLSDSFMTESDLYTTFKNKYLAIGNEFDLVYCNGTKVKQVYDFGFEKATGVIIPFTIAMQSLPELNQIDTPNYFIQSKTRIAENKWTVSETRYKYYYVYKDSVTGVIINKSHYEQKQITGQVEGISASLPDSASYKYVQVYGNGLQREQRDEYGLITKYTHNNCGNVVKVSTYNEAAPNGEKLETTYAYDGAGELLTSITENGITTSFSYDVTPFVQIASVRIGNTTPERYVYSADLTQLNNVYKTQPAEKPPLRNTLTYDGESARLNSVSDQGDRSYTFDYNEFGELSKYYRNGTLIAQNTIARNNDDKTDVITEKRYRNNIPDEISTTLDKYGRVKSVQGIQAATYIYEDELENSTFKESPACAALSKITDNYASEVCEYNYDEIGKLTGYTVKDLNGNVKQSVEQTTNNVTTCTFGGEPHTSSVTYNNQTAENKQYIEPRVANIKDSVTVDNLYRGMSKDYEYDALGRIFKTHKKIHTQPTACEGSFTNTRLTSYITSSVRPYKIEDVTAISNKYQTSNTTELSYCPNGNISQTKLTSHLFKLNAPVEDGWKTTTEKTVAYEYDALNRLTKETNSKLGTFNYNYDSKGNLSSVERVNNDNTTETLKTLTYSNGRCIAVNNDNIQYDRLGNVVQIGQNKSSYYYNLDGKLQTITHVDPDYAYNTCVNAYNHQGVRRAKTVSIASGPEITKTYQLKGNKILGETWSDGTKLCYLYDEKGVCGIVYNTCLYVLERDFDGSITKILIDGRPICEYHYDAWGNCSVDINTDLLDESFAEDERFVINNNPFRWKGYYYDVETELYYCNYRYYSPLLCSWISPDSLDYLDPETVDGLNLYCYCYNNPVMYVDPSGHSGILIGLIIGAIVGAGVGFGTAAYIDYTDDGQLFNGSVKWYDYLGATVLGGVLGAGIGAGAGYILPYISTFANTSFTFGSGLSLASNGTVAIVNGLTVTGEQILKGLGILAAIIGKSGGYTVKKYLNDHDPSHVHIYGDDIADKAHGIRIGADGKPLPGQGKLPHGAKKAIKKLWKIISQLL